MKNIITGYQNGTRYQIHMDLDGLIEFRGRELLAEPQCIGNRVRFARIDLAFQGFLTFAQGCHLTPPPR